MIHFSKCKIPYPHDFEDHSCKKCNAFLMIADGDLMIKGKIVSKRMVLCHFVAVILCTVIFLS